MQLNIHIDPTVTETRIDVTAAQLNDDVKRIQRLVGDTAPVRLIAYKGSDGVVVNFDQILRFYTKDKNVWVQTTSGHFRVKERMKTLEAMLTELDFVRISQAEIVNIAFVERFDVSGTAAIGLRLKDGTRCFVSRRSLPAFKQKLGF